MPEDRPHVVTRTVGAALGVHGHARSERALGLCMMLRLQQRPGQLKVDGISLVGAHRRRTRRRPLVDLPRQQQGRGGLPVGVLVPPATFQALDILANGLKQRLERRSGVVRIAANVLRQRLLGVFQPAEAFIGDDTNAEHASDEPALSGVALLESSQALEGL